MVGRARRADGKRRRLVPSERDYHPGPLEIAKRLAELQVEVPEIPRHNAAELFELVKRIGSFEGPDYGPTVNALRDGYLEAEWQWNAGVRYVEIGVEASGATTVARFNLDDEVGDGQDEELHFELAETDEIVEAFQRLAKWEV